MNEHSRCAAWAIVFCIATTSAMAGSLYDEETYEGLTSDLAARRAGDTVTVLIYETASAAASATAQTERTSQADAEVYDKSDGISAGFSVANDFSGDGEIGRSGRLVARVSGTVERVADNGRLFVRGEQVIRFNQETQSIRVSGWVRPEDLSSANTVLSTRLADANIEYTGEGLLGDAERPGWFRRMLNRIF